MLNYQKSAIFCVLFTAVCLQSSNAQDLSFEQKIKCLNAALTDAKDLGLIPESGINHFKSWNYWKKLPPTWIEYLLDIYDKMLTDAEMSYHSEDRHTLAGFACDALDTYIQKSLKGCKTMRNSIRKILNDGEFIEYSAYYEERLQDITTRNDDDIQANSWHTALDDDSVLVQLVLSSYLIRK